MFDSVLIANRGEIACRVIRTARRMGLRTIAVYSRVDRRAPHVAMADQAIEIGAAPARLSYLDPERILQAARDSGAQAIHPGYGFLSENADFAEACADAGVVFTGPPPAAIRAMGAKDEARRLMREAGVAVVPGYDGADQDEATLSREAQRIGYPALIKAVAGGGGKGMRRVDDAAGFHEALAGARRESEAFFGDSRVLIEKYISSPRHIEVQIFGDSFGEIVHLFERDCSLQRRHQKVIEEAPAPGMTAEFRRTVCDAAIAVARAVKYQGAGTVEFIADASQGLRTDRVWFLEMNTRLQVEHPVTEAVTGFDLVEWQLRVAAGERLPVLQDGVALNGHAIEARLYAEDPSRDFLPSPGRIHALEWPQGDGVRIDAGVESGGDVSAHYDPMIAKIIAHGANREEARLRLAAALSQVRVAGPVNNAAFLRDIAASEIFASGVFDTHTIARDFAPLSGGRAIEPRSVRLGALGLFEQDWKRACDGGNVLAPWRKGAAGERIMRVSVNDLPFACSIEHDGTIESAMAHLDGASAMNELRERQAQKAIIAAGDCIYIFAQAGVTRVARAAPGQSENAGAGSDGAVRAPMHGKLTMVFVKPGEMIARGQRIAIVEAMKMEHVLAAPVAGVVAEIGAEQGAQITQGALVARIEIQKT